jgi:SAM-dependent methyltransferase
MSESEGWDWGRALQLMPGRWTGVAEELFPLVEELRKRGCRSVYDLGCGVGRHTVFLAQQGFEVSAADISPSALEHTRSGLEQAGVDAKLRRLDMRDWPFEDGCFDAVVAYNVVYHAMRDEVEAVLAEARRTLRPGGLLLITFKSTLDSEYGKGRELAPFTWAPLSGIEQDVAHYYVDEDEAKRLLQDYELLSMVHKQELPVSAASERHRAHWVVRAARPR